MADSKFTFHRLLPLLLWVKTIATWKTVIESMQSLEMDNFRVAYTRFLAFYSDNPSGLHDGETPAKGRMEKPESGIRNRSRKRKRNRNRNLNLRNKSWRRFCSCTEAAPKAKVDKILLDLHNSPHSTQPHSITAEYDMSEGQI